MASFFLLLLWLWYILPSYCILLSYRTAHRIYEDTFSISSFSFLFFRMLRRCLFERSSGAYHAHKRRRSSLFPPLTLSLSYSSSFGWKSRPKGGKRKGKENGRRQEKYSRRKKERKKKKKAAMRRARLPQSNWIAFWSSFVPSVFNERKRRIIKPRQPIDVVNQNKKKRKNWNWILVSETSRPIPQVAPFWIKKKKNYNDV